MIGASIGSWMCVSIFSTDWISVTKLKIRILKLSIREFYGVYLRGGTQLTDKLYPYVVFGYTQATLELDDGSSNFHDGLGGVSYGAGVDLQVKPEVLASIEYINYFDTVGVELSAFSIGLTKSF